VRTIIDLINLSPLGSLNAMLLDEL